MGLVIANAKIYDTKTGKFKPGAMVCDGDKILSVGENPRGVKTGDEVVDAGGRLLVPGFIDMHTHGRAGHDFISASAPDLDEMKKSYLACGVTTVVPTLASAEVRDWISAIEAINGRHDPLYGGCGARLFGCHLEGRYLNPLKRGIQSADLLTKPDIYELKAVLEASGLPLRVSFAPELDEDGKFSKFALKNGITLSAGHTDMTYEQAKTAERRGVNAYTHLYNAMSPMHHRRPGAAGAALSGDAYVELICDGFHVAPAAVRVTWKCKGSEKIILISDSMAGAGAADGEYEIAGALVFVKDGKATAADGTLGGSTLDLFNGIKNMMRFCFATLEEVLPCATINPAAALGIDSLFGSLEPGKYADAVLLGEDENGEPKIDGVVVAGRVARL